MSPYRSVCVKSEQVLSRIEGHSVYRVLLIIGAFSVAVGAIAAAVTSAFAYLSDAALTVVAVALAALVGIIVFVRISNRPTSVSVVVSEPCWYADAPHARPSPAVGISGSAAVTNNSGRPLFILKARLRVRQLDSDTVGIIGMGLRGQPMDSVANGETANVYFWFHESTRDLVGRESLTDVLELLDQDKRTHTAPITFKEAPSSALVLTPTPTQASEVPEA